MKIITSSAQIESAMPYELLLKFIESAGRTCYKSEDKITEDSAEKFVRNLIKRGHEAVLEHGSISVRVICDRGVSHEWVRHRIAAYCQESTRYCNYSKEQFGKEITFIAPSKFYNLENPTEQQLKQYELWTKSMAQCEQNYFDALELGMTPQEARAVLPNSLKTEMFITFNLREWRHFFKLRTSKGAHPDIRNLSIRILDLFKEIYPAFFEDIEVEE